MTGVFIFVKIVTVKLKGKRFHVNQFPISYHLSSCQVSSEACDAYRSSSKRILFKKNTVMPKGQSAKVKDNICNISITEIVIHTIDLLIVIE